MTDYRADASGGFLLVVVVYIYAVQPCLKEWTTDVLLYTRNHAC